MPVSTRTATVTSAGVSNALARPVGASDEWVTVAGGPSLACGLQEDDAGDRSIWCWGHSSDALGPIVSQEPMLVADALAGSWDDLVVDRDFLCARDGHDVLCGGSVGDSGAFGLGWGATGELQFPEPVALGRTWEAFTSREETSCAIDVDGDLYGFGDNRFGELGSGGTEYPAPVWIP